jgi:hypothetical protein
VLLWQQNLPKSRKGTIVSHLKSLKTNKTTTNDIGNPGPCLEQAHICGGVKPVKDNNTLSS